MFYFLGMIPSHFYFPDAIKLLLHWRLFYLSHSHYKQFGISGSAMKRLINPWDLTIVCFLAFNFNFETEEFAQEHIYYPEFEKRKEYSKNNFPEMFSKVTLLLDGTHCPIEYREWESLKIWQHNPVAKKDYISYKKKYVAMNTQAWVQV